MNAVEVRLGPYGDQRIRIATLSAGDHPVQTRFIVLNLDGRPVILLELTGAEKQTGSCGDCGDAAIHRVLELDGRSWLWCGLCHLGG